MVDFFIFFGMLMRMVINSIAQVILFSIIPLAWWFFTARKRANFFEWIGFKRPKFQDKSKLWKTIVAATLVFAAVLALTVQGLLPQTNDLLWGLRTVDLGLFILLPIAVYAFLQTGLSEEIFFRGFLAKRLISKFGFVAGNIVQALIFAFMHLAFVILIGTELGILGNFLVFAIPMIFSWLAGYINEKIGSGSILPGWIMHGTANFITAGLYVLAIT